VAGILVVGGGPAGLESSWHLAERGQEVILIEADEELGGRPRWYTCKAVDQCRKCGACLVSEKVYRVENHPAIKVMTGTEVSKAYHNGTGFQIKLSRGEAVVEIQVAGIIMATGFDLLSPARRPEMGYAHLDNVVTAHEMEQMLAKGSGDWEDLLGAMARIAIVKCFGSRESIPGVTIGDQDGDQSLPGFWKHRSGVPYCSRVCCLYSEKLAVVLQDKIPGATVDIFGIDNQKYHPVYAVGQNEGYRLIRGIPSRIYPGPGQAVSLRYEDGQRSLLSEGVYDWVVLCPAVLPGDKGRGLSEMLQVARDGHGFIVSRAGFTDQPGVFAAGSCTGPQTIVESLHSGQTAAENLLMSLGL